MKKVLSIVLSLAMILSTVAFALPVVEFDAAESAVETVQTVSETKAELSALTPVPGLNMYTGTTEKVTFDDAAQKSNFSIAAENGKYTKYDLANLNDGTHNNVLSFYRPAHTTTASNWCGINMNNIAFDGTRTYQFVFDYQFNIPSAVEGTAYWGGFTSVIEGSNPHKIVSSNAAINNWATWNMAIKPKKGYQIDFRLWVGEDGDNGTCGELNTYIDNVAIIPYYHANYYNNDGTDTVTVKEFLYDANGKIMTTYAPDASVVPARDGYKLKGWATSAGSTELVTSVALANEDIDLYAVWELDTSLRKTVKPGLNMVGAKTTAWTFEEADGMNNKDFFTAGGGVVANPLSDDVNGSALVYGNSYTSASFPDVTFALPSEMDGNRPIYVSFKYYKDYTPSADEEGSLAENLWVMKNGGTYKAADINKFFPNEGWKKFSGLVNFNAAYNAGNKSEINKDPIKSIIIKTKINANPGAENQYFDDIMYIPSYKLTFVANDGTDAQTDKYVLFDADGNILTSYAFTEEDDLDNKYRYTFLGWSTDKDATEPMESIALANEDVTLYGIWDIDETLPEKAELVWDFETAESQTWSARRFNTTYKNGMMVLDSSVIEAKDNYINHSAVPANVTKDTSVLKYFIFKARSTGDVNAIRFYFKTSGNSWAEANAFNVNINANSNEFTEYAVDMSQYPGWVGNYEGCMLQVKSPSNTGILEIEEIGFYNEYESDEPIKYEHHFNITSTSEFEAWGHTYATVNDDKTVSFGRKLIYIVPNYDKGEKATHYYDEATDTYIEITADNPLPEGAEGYRVQNQGAAYTYVKGATLDASIYNKLIVKAKGDDLAAIKIYYQTSLSGSYVEARTSSASPVEGTDGYSYYVFDMSTRSDYTGEVKEFMIAPGDYFESVVYDVMLTNEFKVPAPDKVEKKEHHFAITSSGVLTTWGFGVATPNDDGTVTFGRADNGSAQGAINAYVKGTTLDASVYNKLVFKVKGEKLGSFTAYYSTTGSSGYTEAKTVTSSAVASADGYSYYVFDFSSRSDYSGNVDSFMLAPRAVGTMTLYDIMLTNVFETPKADGYVWDFEGLSTTEDGIAAGVKAWSGHHKISFDGHNMVLTRITNEEAGTSSGGVNVIPQKTLAAKDYPYLVAKVVRPANGATMSTNTYYVTGSMSNISGAGCVGSTKANFADDKYDYYVTDFTAKSDYAEGNIKYLVFTTGSVGVWTIDELILTNDLSFIGIEPAEPEEPPKEVDKIYFNGASEITEDQGTTTLSVYIRYTDGTEETNFDGIQYITDSVCAQVVKNDDGSATVTAKMNGAVNIKVILADGTSFDHKITITGQADRIAANDFNVVMFGNSIRKHAPSPSIGWPATFNWGMAASSEAQDYAHRFVYYMEQKYGEGTVKLYDTTSIASFERAINNWESDPKQEATIKSSVATFVKEAVNSKADIITFQMGENASGADYPEYLTAIRYMVTEIQKELPDAVYAFCTPFWGGDGKIQAVKELCEELNIPAVLIHKLNTRENYAYDGTWITPETIDGVKIHPGDKGMDNIAKMIFEQVNIILSANEKTVYTTTPKTVEITAPADGISEAYGTLQLEAKVTPSDASQEVVWTSSNDYIASVDENGLVKAYNNGTVTITATSRFVSDVYATVDLEISGQTEPHTVTYDANTWDWVDNMPKPNTLAKDGFVFDKVYPTRFGYRFLGWALNADATEEDVIETYDVTENITVYAVWEEAYRWDFNREGYKEEFTIDYGFNQYVVDGNFMAIATDTNLETGAVLKVNSPSSGIMVPVRDYYALVIRMQNTEIASNTTLDITFTTTNGDVTMSKKVTTTEYTDYEFVLDGMSGDIMGFSFTPTNIDCTINIDHIEFMKEPKFMYDANAGTDSVGGMPASLYDISSGIAPIPAEAPQRTGYTFLGWVTDPDSKLIIETESVPAVEGGKLYAAWDKNDHWEFDSLKKWTNGVGNATTYDIGEDGVLYIMDDAGSVDITVGLSGNVGYDVATTTKALKTRIKYDFGDNDAQHSQLFFQTSDATALAEGNSGHGENYGKAKVDEFIDYTIDLNYKTNFTGALKSFRWDPFQCFGEMWIDYIRFTDSEANRMIADGETMKLFYDDDWANFIVRKGAVLAPVGGRLVKGLVISGDIDMTNGYLMTSGKVEIAEDADYAVYTLDAATAGVNADTKMYISGSANAVDAVDGANYVVKLYNGTGFVAFVNGNTVTINKITKNDEADELAINFVNYNGTRLASVDTVEFEFGTAEVAVAEGCTAKLITLENMTSVKPVFADITIG